MRADGFKVVLSGDGADELFGGYTWNADAYHRWQRLAWRARWIPNHAMARTLGRYVPALRPVSLAREVAAYRLTATPIEYVATSFNIAPVAGMTRTLRQRRLFDALEGLPLPERAYLASNLEDIHVHMRECLNSKDKVTMRHGIEGRVPFIENALISQGINLPVRHKYHRGTRKVLVDNMARKWLPEEVVRLPKLGFNAPPGLWEDAIHLLRDGHVSRLLKWPAKEHRNILAMLRTHRYYTFRLIGCEIWLRMHLDGARPEQLAQALRDPVDG
jgi:asparagine synthase (glutamine-hydrolysing)